MTVKVVLFFLILYTGKAYNNTCNTNLLISLGFQGQQ